MHKSHSGSLIDKIKYSERNLSSKGLVRPFEGLLIIEVSKKKFFYPHKSFGRSSGYPLPIEEKNFKNVVYDLLEGLLNIENLLSIAELYNVYYL